MKKYVFIIFLVVVLVTPNTSYSQEKHPIDKRLEEAVDKDVSTLGMKTAGRKALEEWEQEMNRYYDLMVKKLEGEEKVALEKAQFDWENYKNSEENFIDKLYGTMRGSFFSVLRIEKRIEMIRERALNLKFNYELIMEEKPYEDYIPKKLR